MEKSEEQQAQEREAVASMARATANTRDVISRVSTLVSALEAAKRALDTLKYHVGTHSLISQNQRTTDYIAAEIASINTAIGK